MTEGIRELSVCWDLGDIFGSAWGKPIFKEGEMPRLRLQPTMFTITGHALR